MRVNVLFVVLALATVAFAGCADEVPTGEVPRSVSGLSSDGNIELVYNAEVNPYSQAPTPEGGEELCALDAIFGQDPTGSAPVCIPPNSTVSVNLKLPQASADGYSLFLIGEEAGELNVGTLVESSDEPERGLYTYTLEKLYEDEDFTGVYDFVEVRMGDFVLGRTQDASAGIKNFEILQENRAAGFTGTWRGAELTMQVSGLPDVGGPYVGWLVSEDPDTGVLSHDIQFPVTNGEVVYRLADGRINDYAEVHIHVGASKVNMGISPINEN